jgi:peptidyl-tRNA hydrolase
VYAGVPTYIINDERATGSPESIVLVIGPAAGGTIDGIVGDLKILD